MIGVVADDTTGANDIGIMFSNNHYSVKVVTFGENMDLAKDSDVLIIDTDSRLDPPDVSYHKVFSATKQLKKLGCSMYYNKTCSVFRGNIGPELDGMMDALQEKFALVILSFPKNGRQTVNGIHTVYGELLENSEFAKDPVHPMKESDLVSILEKQTKRKVSLVTLDIVRQGPTVLRNKIEQMREISNFCIIDAETQEDLTIVAEAAQYPVLCGSSAIGEELPKFLSIEKKPSLLGKMDMRDKNGVLVISGSLMPQTKGQTAYLSASGVPMVVLDSRKIFEMTECKKEITRIIKEATALLIDGKDVLVMADNRVEVVAATKEMGEKLKLDPLAVSKQVSAVLADITEILVDETGLKRLVVAGGDTSGTDCRKLGIQGNYVLKEIATGLPSGLAIGRNMLIVLKSGSFGKEDFLLRAVEHLKEF